MPGYTISFTTESLAEAHAQAARRRTSLARLMLDLLAGGPAQIIADASGGVLDAGLVRYALDRAEAIMDSKDEWGTDAADWLGEADKLTGWLKCHPYRPDAPERVQTWWNARPDCVRTAMAQALSAAAG